MANKHDPFRLSKRDIENEKLISFLQAAERMRAEAVEHAPVDVQVW